MWYNIYEVIFVYIYIIRNNINGKVYVGQTVRSIEERFSEHCRNNKSNIGKAIKKYGRENFSCYALRECETIDELNEAEKEEIKRLKANVRGIGYNLCDGGENTIGFHHSEASKAKMSEAKSKMYMGSNNPFYGKHHTSEQCQKWSRERSGRTLTREWKEKIGQARYKPVINLDTREVFESVKAAAESVNVAPTNITQACKGKKTKIKGYRWAYVNTVPSSEKEKV